MSESLSAWDHVRGMESYSLCDWPGHPCCTIFLGGCNLHCPTCHNFELAWDMHRLPVIPQTRIKAFLRDRAGWLDGVTVTGGEPTNVPGVGEVLFEIKKTNLPLKLDSNGMRPDVVADLMHCKLVDVFAVDVKGPYDKYPALTGGGVSEVAARANMERIFAMAAARPQAFYFRLTRVPGLTDRDVDTARGYLPEGFELIIQDYVPPRRKTKHAQPDHETRRAAGNVVN